VRRGPDLTILTGAHLLRILARPDRGWEEMPPDAATCVVEAFVADTTQRQNLLSPNATPH
jgi:hypothetical protein